MAGNNDKIMLLIIYRDLITSAHRTSTATDHLLSISQHSFIVQSILWRDHGEMLAFDIKLTLLASSLH